MKAKPPSSEITKRLPRPRVVPDPDYLADLEQNDGQMRKRMKERERGQKPKPPKEP